ENQLAHHAALPPQRVTLVELGGGAEMDPEARIEIALIRDLGLEHRAPMEGPARAIEFDRQAVAIALGIGGIVPGGRVDEAQIEELRARIVCIGVVVEYVRRRE